MVINDDRYRLLQAELLGMATHCSADTLRMKFHNVPFTPYAPVRQQLGQHSSALLPWRAWVDGR